MSNNKTFIPSAGADYFIDGALQILEKLGYKVKSMERFNSIGDAADYAAAEIGYNANPKVCYLLNEFFLNSFGNQGDAHVYDLIQGYDALFQSGENFTGVYGDLVIRDFICNRIEVSVTGGISPVMKLPLSPADVSGSGDANPVLLDEQVLAGDPRGGAPGTPVGPNWQPGGATSGKEAIIDLGGSYSSVEMYYYCDFGSDDIEVLSSIDGGGSYQSEGLFSTDLNQWRTTGAFTTNLANVDHIKIIPQDQGAFVPCKINEVVCYGATGAGAGDSALHLRGWKVLFE